MAFSVSDTIYDFCLQNNVDCAKATALEFDRLAQMLIEFNSHTNVTALKTPQDIAYLHFIDSLCALKYDIFPKGAKVIDIGCGAGFPGLPIKMLRRDLELSFVDSTAKKLKFTQSAAEEFGFDIGLYPFRAEELVNKGHREKYDCAVSRAVASLPVLLELVMPFVKQGGVFAAYKSAKETDLTKDDSELAMSKNALKALGAKVEKVLDAGLTAADGEKREHSIILIRKVGKTPAAYPRRYAAILKKPL